MAKHRAPGGASYLKVSSTVAERDHPYSPLVLRTYVTRNLTLPDMSTLGLVMIPFMMLLVSILLVLNIEGTGTFDAVPTSYQSRPSSVLTPPPLPAPVSTTAAGK